jgi:hypothetical protein
MGELVLMAYTPLYIRKPETGLVQSRQEFILPDDAYPVLENAYVWRERIKRRQGLALLGRLRRKFTDESIGLSGASPWSFNIYATVVPPIVPEPNAQIEPGSVVITIGATVLIDQGNGTLATAPPSGVTGTINYLTGNVVVTGAGAGVASTITFNYFPALPVMGLRSRELNSINVEQLIAFDTVYAYRYIGGWQEFIPGTTWTGTDSDFFWSTNYWVGDGNQKIFWVTNFSGPAGDPIRYTNGAQWVDFAPQINAAGDVLAQALALLPFRSRLVAFNTLEGPNLAGSVAFTNRIRWAAIGNPFTTVSPIVSLVNPDAWRDDRNGPGAGKGGFLDIPTSESIVAVGFVRDNLVIYCERSTWQLRYTGRTIAPFQIEKVNSELGSESTFSAVQFDTSLVGIGDKGIVECDSFKSQRIDIKIPDLVFEFKNDNEGTKRVHGIRDFQQRLAYWTYVYNPGDTPNGKYPNRRLVYNYENDSWAIFTDSLTTLGTFQNPVPLTWAQAGLQIPPLTWANANFPWLNVPAQFPSIVGGNQQGYVMYLSSNLQPKVSNDVSLYISNITANAATPTVITSPDHNLATGQVIQILGIPSNDPFASLNGRIFGVVVLNANSFQLWVYSNTTKGFTIPQLNFPGTYLGGGQMKIRDGFSILSKKFNFLEQGENIQMGYLDVLMDNTESGEVTLYVYLDYNDSQPINVLFQNINPQTNQPDTFFNSTVPTYPANGIQSLKNWQRVFCPVRGNFITLEWTFSNEQLTTIAQESDVQIDAQILWIRPAGRQLVNV